MNSHAKIHGPDTYLPWALCPWSFCTHHSQRMVAGKGGKCGVGEAGAPPSPATHHLGNLGTFTQLFEPQFSQLYTGKKDPSIAGDSDVDTWTF